MCCAFLCPSSRQAPLIPLAWWADWQCCHCMREDSDVHSQTSPPASCLSGLSLYQPWFVVIKPLTLLIFWCVSLRSLWESKLLILSFRKKFSTCGFGFSPYRCKNQHQTSPWLYHIKVMELRMKSKPNVVPQEKICFPPPPKHLVEGGKPSALYILEAALSTSRLLNWERERNAMSWGPQLCSKTCFPIFFISHQYSLVCPPYLQTMIADD